MFFTKNMYFSPTFMIILHNYSILLLNLYFKIVILHKKQKLLESFYYILHEIKYVKIAIGFFVPYAYNHK